MLSAGDFRTVSPPEGRLTGGHTTINGCARGFVSKECGGNPYDEKSGFRMTHPEVLFENLDRLAKAGDEAGMREALANFARRNPEDVVGIAKYQALIHELMGRIDEAVETLTGVIDRGLDHDEICRRRRASCLLRRGDLGKALADIEIALAAKSEIAIRFHEDLCFQRAYVYAKLGDPRFESEITAFPDNYVGRGDTMLTAGDLRVMYSEAAQG